MTDPLSPLAGYQLGLAEAELRFQRCGGCGDAVFYPRVLCPHCGATELSWETSAGFGSVYATTTMAVARGQEPYNVALIDLDEGFRMMSRVDGVDPRDVEIGARVRIAIVDEGGPLPVFRLEPGA
ncbi:MAG: Zn-ribbon domain-containing OB-fold protein [Solirubrobacterales bacterium]